MNEINISIPDVFEYLGIINISKNRQTIGYAKLIRN